jgi:hypothetical protein
VVEELLKKTGRTLAGRAVFGFNKEFMNRLRFRLPGFLVSLFNTPTPAPPPSTVAADVSRL